MKIGISTKLFAAVLATAALVVAVVAGATRWNFDRGFLGYLNELAAERMELVLPRLAAVYAEHGNWDRLRDNPGFWFRLLRPGPPGHDAPPDPTSPPALAVSDLTGASLRLGLVDAQQQFVMGYRELDATMQRRPVLVDGLTVGWLVLAPFQSVADGGDQRFQTGQQRALIGTAALALVLAALIAWWVSRALLAPVREVAAATHRLAAGHYDTRVQVASRDEVGALAHDFNHLARTLERNTALRREFVADVSHELRTPLAVLRGELEAMEDGIRPLARAGIASLQGEVKQLGQLVDDLYELALSDAGALGYKMAPLNLGRVLHRAAESQRRALEDKGLTLEVDVPDLGLRAQADKARLQQLFANLLGNACRYTDAPGLVRLAARRDGDWIHVDVQDTPPTVPDAALARLFERFYRADGSRSRATGGAGLGLAICRNIVLAHEGEIEARPSPLGGVWIAVKLRAL